MMLAFRALVCRQCTGSSTSLSFGVVISPLSTRLMPIFFVSRLNQRGTTVSLEAKPFFRFPFRMPALQPLQ